MVERITEVLGNRTRDLLRDILVKLDRLIAAMGLPPVTSAVFVITK
jgi:hypothetical protein